MLSFEKCSIIHPPRYLYWMVLNGLLKNVLYFWYTYELIIIIIVKCMNTITKHCSVYTLNIGYMAHENVSLFYRLWINFAL